MFDLKILLQELEKYIDLRQLGKLPISDDLQMLVNHNLPKKQNLQLPTYNDYLNDLRKVDNEKVLEEYLISILHLVSDPEAYNNYQQQVHRYTSFPEDEPMKPTPSNSDEFKWVVTIPQFSTMKLTEVAELFNPTDVLSFGTLKNGDGVINLKNKPGDKLLHVLAEKMQVTPIVTQEKINYGPAKKILPEDELKKIAARKIWADLVNKVAQDNKNNEDYFKGEVINRIKKLTSEDDEQALKTYNALVSCIENETAIIMEFRASSLMGNFSEHQLLNIFEIGQDPTVTARRRQVENIIFSNNMLDPETYEPHTDVSTTLNANDAIRPRYSALKIIPQQGLPVSSGYGESWIAFHEILKSNAVFCFGDSLEGGTSLTTASHPASLLFQIRDDNLDHLIQYVKTRDESHLTQMAYIEAWLPQVDILESGLVSHVNFGDAGKSAAPIPPEVISTFQEFGIGVTNEVAGTDAPTFNEVLDGFTYAMQTGDQEKIAKYMKDFPMLVDVAYARNYESMQEKLDQLTQYITQHSAEVFFESSSPLLSKENRLFVADLCKDYLENCMTEKKLPNPTSENLTRHLSIYLAKNKLQPEGKLKKIIANASKLIPALNFILTQTDLHQIMSTKKTSPSAPSPATP